MAVPHRDEQCPERGVGLSHTQDAEKRPDGRCVHCGAFVRIGPRDMTPHPADFLAAVPSLDDRPHPAFCREGDHMAAVCFRIGHGERLEWICYQHLCRLVRDHQ